MLIMNQAETMVVDCIAICIAGDEYGIWIKGVLPNKQAMFLGRYESIEAAQKVLNEFDCKHA